jgi:hypothetical protein
VSPVKYELGFYIPELKYYLKVFGGYAELWSRTALLLRPMKVNRRFGISCRLHHEGSACSPFHNGLLLQAWRRRKVAPKCRLMVIGLQDCTAQET